jgi:hypothetical protein
MLGWHREGKFPIEKLVRFYAVSLPSKCISDVAVFLNLIINRIQAEDFELALADMRSGVAIKPVLVW